MNRELFSMIIKHFPETFRIRVGEWLMAVVLMTWGVILLYTDPDVIGKLFGTLLLQWPTWLLAACTTGIGLIRFCTLLINGLWRRSPYVRIMMSMMSMMFWTQITLGLFFSGYVTTGWAVYPWFAVIEIYHVFRAAVDAKAMEEKYATGDLRYGKSG